MFKKDKFEIMKFQTSLRENFAAISFGNVIYAKFSKDKFRSFAILVGFVLIFVSLVSGELISFGDVKIDTEIILIIEDGVKKFEFSSGDSLNIENYGEKGVSGSFRNLQSFDYEGDTIKPYISVASNGRVNEAAFRTGVGGNYLLGNEIVDIPAGSNVLFKDGEGKIVLPDNARINSPKPIPNEAGEGVFVYEKKNGIDLGNGIKLERIGFEGGKVFISQDKVDFLGVIASTKGKRVYFDFFGRANLDYDGAYISANPSEGVIVIGSNRNGITSPAIMFKQDNKFGITFDRERGHFALQSIGNVDGAYLKIEKGGKVQRLLKGEQITGPKIDFTHGFLINNDNHGAFYDRSRDKVYVKPNNVVIKDFGSDGRGTDSVKLTIRDGFLLYGDELKRANKGLKLGFSDNKEFGFGPNEEWITLIGSDRDPQLRVRHYPKYPGLKTGISDTNYALTKEGLKRYTGINIRTKGRGTTFLSRPVGVRYMYDLIHSMTPYELSKVRTINLGFGYPWGASGYAESYGMRISLYVGSGKTTGGLRPGLFAHEMAHILDFANGKNRGFNRDWYRSGIDRRVTTSGYSHTGGERISEFMDELAYNNNRINRYLNSESRKEWFRAALVVAHKHGFLTDERFNEILKIAKLPNDPASITKYFKRIPVSNV